ncbi:MAG: ferric reductase-like transmembrane domain-containing protein [Rhizobiaceae bacterium]
MKRARPYLIWGVFALAVVVPIALAMTSPLLAWRQPIYIVAGIAGVIAMALLLAQPLLAGGYLPGLSLLQSRGVHQWVGIALVVAVIAHVGGLWITSPPDVIDALMFASPTPFSAWGVMAMWAVFAAAILAALRQSLGLRPRWWRAAHTALVVVAVAGSVVHALLIEGTMDPVSKAILCGLVLLATLKTTLDLRSWVRPRR